MADERNEDSLSAGADVAVAEVDVPPAAGVPAEATAFASAALELPSNPDNSRVEEADRDSAPTLPRSLVPLPEGYSATPKRSSIPPGKLSLSSKSGEPPAWTASPSPLPPLAEAAVVAAPSMPPPPPYRAPAPSRNDAAQNEGPVVEPPRPPPYSSQPPLAARVSSPSKPPGPVSKPPGPVSKPPGSAAALTPMRIIEVKKGNVAAPAAAVATQLPGTQLPATQLPATQLPVATPAAAAAIAPFPPPPTAPAPSPAALSVTSPSAQAISPAAALAALAEAPVVIPIALAPASTVEVQRDSRPSPLAAVAPPKPGALTAEAPTPPDTPAAVSSARISLSPDAPTPPETPALRRELWQRMSGATPPEMQAVRDPDAALPNKPAAPLAAPPVDLVVAEVEVALDDAHELEAISEDELTEVDAVSDRQPEVQPARRLPRRPAKRTTFTDGSGEDAKRKHWWEELWSDDFQRAELPFPQDEFLKEVDFIEASLAIETSAVVLDVACGSGEHCVELARRGYTTVGYDLSDNQLERAGENAKRAGQTVNFLQGDVRDMAFDQMFDGILCWDTSFGFFEEEKNLTMLANVYKALKPGGSFLLDVPNRDFVLRHQPMQSWFEGNACVCMDDTYVDFITSRLCVKRTVMLDDGRNREWYYSLKLYSLHDIGKMLHDVGFKVAQVSGHVATRGAFLGPYSPRVITLAVKPS